MKSRAFTIVELLIVIVVIAVLAAVSVVAYNGIQQRAKNTRITAGVKVYETAFESYKAIHGTYPTSAGCLGAGYPNDICWLYNGAMDRAVDSALDTALSEFVPTKPVLSTEYMAMFGMYQRTGLVYFLSGTYSEFRYYLGGNDQSCIGGFTFANEGALTRCIKVLTT